MVNRKSIYNELQELRTLVLQEDLEQARLHVRLLVSTCDRLTEPIQSSTVGGRSNPPTYAAEQIGLSVPLVRSLRGYVSEAGFALESDPRRALRALEQALLAIQEPTTERE